MQACSPVSFAGHAAFESCLALPFTNTSGLRRGLDRIPGVHLLEKEERERLGRGSDEGSDEDDNDDEGLASSELGSDQEQPEAAIDDEQGSDEDELEAASDDEQQAYAEGQSGSDAESEGDEDEDAEDLSASAGASGQ